MTLRALYAQSEKQKPIFFGVAGLRFAEFPIQFYLAHRRLAPASRLPACHDLPLHIRHAAVLAGFFAGWGFWPAWADFGDGYLASIKHFGTGFCRRARRRAYFLRVCAADLTAMAADAGARCRLARRRRHAPGIRRRHAGALADDRQKACTSA